MRIRRSRRGIATETIESIAGGLVSLLVCLEEARPTRQTDIFSGDTSMPFAWRRRSEEVVAQQVHRQCWCRARQSPSPVGMKTIFIVVVRAADSKIQRGTNSLGSTLINYEIGALDVVVSGDGNGRRNVVKIWLGRGHTQAILAQTIVEPGLGEVTLKLFWRRRFMVAGVAAASIW